MRLSTGACIPEGGSWDGTDAQVGEYPNFISAVIKVRYRMSSVGEKEFRVVVHHHGEIKAAGAQTAGHVTSSQEQKKMYRFLLYTQLSLLSSSPGWSARGMVLPTVGCIFPISK